jgi:hypothetical protein
MKGTVMCLIFVAACWAGGYGAAWLRQRIARD